MKRYWDSSALVDALHDESIRQATRQPEQFTRLHALTEVFSTLTGGRLGFRYLPEEAAAMIRDLVLGFQFVELTDVEVQQALMDAGRRGVRGRACPRLAPRTRSGQSWSQRITHRQP